MTSLQIGVLAILAVLIGRLPKGRQLALLAASAGAIFWLQPNEPVRSLGFWIPIATLAIATVAWAITTSPDTRSWALNWPAAAVLVAVVLICNSSRFLAPASGELALETRLARAILGALGIAGVVIVFYLGRTAQRTLLAAFLVGVILVFVLLKTSALAAAAVHWMQSLRPQTEYIFSNTSLAWLGFSYAAFRLMHTIRDRQAGRLPPVTLAEYVNYVIFFPAFTAGPIDRLERFVGDLRAPRVLRGSDWIDAATRVILGLFKKFVVADLLAVISLSDVLVSHVRSAGWLWVFLYAYAFRIYLDFSGYTDVAIGIGCFLGIQLPENFAAPYLKSNVALFWNSWHISLTQWFRSYVFNPLTRALRTSPRPVPTWLAILVTQASTMLLIGLWHGISWSFAVWGLWHGMGLFVHNRWENLVRNRMPAWTRSPRGMIATRIAGVLLTFHFVALGWVFFVLSSPSSAWETLLKLFGAA